MPQTLLAMGQFKNNENPKNQRCAKHDNECVCVTNNLILVQDRVDQKIATKIHTMISPEKHKPMYKQEIYRYQKKKYTIQEEYAINVKEKE